MPEPRIERRTSCPKRGCVETPGEKASASRSDTATLSLKESALTTSTPPGRFSISERASSVALWAVTMMDGSPPASACAAVKGMARSEEHTSELQSLMRISYAVFFLKKKKIKRRQE